MQAAVICGGGFAETGGPGITLQQELAAVVARTGIRLLGPNTSGFFSPGAGLTASFVPGASLVPAGHVAVVAASGGMNHAVAFLLADAGHGVSLAVGLGNGVDVTAPDVLDYLAGDPRTAAVALHVESVTDGSRLISSISALTPAQAGRGARRRAGMTSGRSLPPIRVRSPRPGEPRVVHLPRPARYSSATSVNWSMPWALWRSPGPGPSRNPAVGVITAQAGPGLLLLDDLRGRAADVPELTPVTQARLSALLPPLTFQRNPVDTGRPGPDFGQLLAAVAADPGIDVIAGYALHEPDAVDLVAAAQEGQVPGVPGTLCYGVGGAGPEHCAYPQLAAGQLGIACAAADPRGVACGHGGIARRRPGTLAAHGRGRRSAATPMSTSAAAPSTRTTRRTCSPG